MCYTTVYLGISSFTLTYTTLDSCITYTWTMDARAFHDVSVKHGVLGERSPGSDRCATHRRYDLTIQYNIRLLIGPIPWGHSGPLCHALSLSLWTSMRRRRATVQWRHLMNWPEAARCGEWAQHFSNAACCICEVISPMSWSRAPFGELICRVGMPAN